MLYFYIIGNFLITLGILAMLTSTVGMMRFPNLRTRLHASGINDTAGLILLISGMLVRSDFTFPMILKTILLIVFMLITNTASSHMVANANTVLEASSDAQEKKLKKKNKLASQKKEEKKHD